MHKTTKMAPQKSSRPQDTPAAASSSSFQNLSQVQGKQQPNATSPTSPTDNGTNNPNSSKVCTSCFFELFSRKKANAKVKNHTTSRHRINEHNTFNKHHNHHYHHNHHQHKNRNSSTSAALIENYHPAIVVSQSDSYNNDSNCTDFQSSSSSSSQQLQASSSSLRAGKNTFRQHEQLTDDSYCSSSSYQQQSPGQSAHANVPRKQRSRLTLNINNNYSQQSICPTVEYIYSKNFIDNDHSNSNARKNCSSNNNNQVNNKAPDIVHSSTPRYKRLTVGERKTGKVIEQLWLQQAPPVVKSKGFDARAEAKLFEAHEGVFLVDPSTGIKYRKGQFLGKGGFANCYEFTDTSTNAVYAGKVISKSHFRKARQREKMMLEIKLHQKLHHENVVAFRGYFEDNENIYLILELCSRKSLDELLKHRGPLTDPEVRYYMRQLVEGCRYIHSNFIIHRDLKLGNLLLNGSMQVKIADFGLATEVSAQDERKKSICGTPNYVAPEVIRKRFYSYEVDVWSIGCIMYTLLCGVTPFETSTLRATYDRISTATYTLPSYLSGPARDLIVRLLDLDPGNRMTLDQVLYEEFFTTGFAPVHLSPSTCSKRPHFPKPNYLFRAKSMNTATKPKLPQLPQQQLQQATNLENKPSTIRKVLTSHVITRTDQDEHGDITDGGAIPTPPKNYQTNSLLKVRRAATTIDLYKVLARCMGSFQSDTAQELQIPDTSILYVTRWVDFSNKYGFGFQLSDESTGVLFNDTTRMALLKDSKTLKYVGWSNSQSTWCLPDRKCMAGECQSKLSVLLFVKLYMYKRLKPSRIDSSDTSAALTKTDVSAETNEAFSRLSSTLSSVTSTSVTSVSGNLRTSFCCSDQDLSTSSSYTAEEEEDSDSGEFEESEKRMKIFTVGSTTDVGNVKDQVINFNGKNFPFSSLLSPSDSIKITSKSELSQKQQDGKTNRHSLPLSTMRTTVTKPASALNSTANNQEKKTSLISKTHNNFPDETRTTGKIMKTNKTEKEETRTNSRKDQFAMNVTSSRSSEETVDFTSSSSTTLGNSSTSVADAAASADGIFVVKWFREDDGIIMQMSNGSYQVNFSDDHAKVLLSRQNDEYIVSFLPHQAVATPNEKETSASYKHTSGRKSENGKTSIQSGKKRGVADAPTKPIHYLLVDICEKGCSPLLADKLKNVRRKLYKLINFEGQAV